MKKKNREFPTEIKRIVAMIANNRCKRCKVDLNEHLSGEFHHIIPVVFGGETLLKIVLYYVIHAIEGHQIFAITTN